MQQAYELVTIMAPDSKAQEQATELVEKVLKRVKGNILHKDEWGEKRMAYPIEGHDSAVYVLYLVELEGKQTEELKRRLSAEKGLLRWALFKHEPEEE